VVHPAFFYQFDFLFGDLIFPLITVFNILAALQCLFYFFLMAILNVLNFGADISQISFELSFLVPLLLLHVFILFPLILFYLNANILVFPAPISDFFYLTVPQIKGSLDVRTILKLVITPFHYPQFRFKIFFLLLCQPYIVYFLYDSLCYTRFRLPFQKLLLLC